MLKKFIGKSTKQEKALRTLSHTAISPFFKTIYRILTDKCCTTKSFRSPNY